MQNGSNILYGDKDFCIGKTYRDDPFLCGVEGGVLGVGTNFSNIASAFATQPGHPPKQQVN